MNLHLSEHSREQLLRVARFVGYGALSILADKLGHLHGGVSVAGVMTALTSAGELTYHRYVAPLLASEVPVVEKAVLTDKPADAIVKIIDTAAAEIPATPVAPVAEVKTPPAV